MLSNGHEWRPIIWIRCEFALLVGQGLLKRSSQGHRLSSGNAATQIRAYWPFALSCLHSDLAATSLTASKSFHGFVIMHFNASTEENAHICTAYVCEFTFKQGVMQLNDIAFGNFSRPVTWNYNCRAIWPDLHALLGRNDAFNMLSRRGFLHGRVLARSGILAL